MRMADSGVFGASDALADAETRWREIAVGSGGTGDSSTPGAGVPSVYSGFVISGGRGFSQDDSDGGFDGLVPAVDAHYYQGYWAGVQRALYNPIHPFGYLLPWGGPEPWDERPGVLPELDNPTPDTRVASGGIGAIAAAIGRAIVSPAEAGENQSGGGWGRLPPFSLDYGGDSPVGRPFLEENESGGSWPMIERLGADEALADATAGPGSPRKWQIDFAMEIANDPEFFPYGETNLDAIARFFDVNRRIGMGRDTYYYTTSGLPLFPVYKQLFGTGTPPLFMGSQAVGLSNESPIFTWGDIIPPEYE